MSLEKNLPTPPPIESKQESDESEPKPSTYVILGKHSRSITDVKEGHSIWDQAVEEKIAKRKPETLTVDSIWAGRNFQYLELAIRIPTPEPFRLLEKGKTLRILAADIGSTDYINETSIFDAAIIDYLSELDKRFMMQQEITLTSEMRKQFVQEIKFAYLGDTAIKFGTTLVILSTLTALKNQLQHSSKVFTRKEFMRKAVASIAAAALSGPVTNIIGAQIANEQLGVQADETIQNVLQATNPIGLEIPNYKIRNIIMGLANHDDNRRASNKNDRAIVLGLHHHLETQPTQSVEELRDGLRPYLSAIIIELRAIVQSMDDIEVSDNDIKTAIMKIFGYYRTIDIEQLGETDPDPTPEELNFYYQYMPDKTTFNFSTGGERDLVKIDEIKNIYIEKLVDEIIGADQKELAQQTLESLNDEKRILQDQIATLRQKIITTQ